MTAPADTGILGSANSAGAAASSVLTAPTLRARAKDWTRAPGRLTPCALRDHANSWRYSARPVTAALLGTTGAVPALAGYDSVVAAAAAAVPA
jgi:hypothetical protein